MFTLPEAAGCEGNSPPEAAGCKPHPCRSPASTVVPHPHPQALSSRKPQAPPPRTLRGPLPVPPPPPPPTNPPPPTHSGVMARHAGHQKPCQRKGHWGSDGSNWGGGCPSLPPPPPRFVTRRHNTRHKKTRSQPFGCHNIFRKAVFPLWPIVFFVTCHNSLPPPPPTPTP